MQPLQHCELAVCLAIPVPLAAQQDGGCATECTCSHCSTACVLHLHQIAQIYVMLAPATGSAATGQDVC